MFPDDESAMATNHQPVQGSFLKLLPTQLEVPEKSESKWGATNFPFFFFLVASDCGRASKQRLYSMINCCRVEKFYGTKTLQGRVTWDTISILLYCFLPNIFFQVYILWNCCVFFLFSFSHFDKCKNPCTIAANCSCI